MPALADLKLFILTVLLMSLTPGPNMVYVISRSICQGRTAGFISLLGIVVAFLCHMGLAIVGLTAIFLTIPHAYLMIKWLGAGYLLWLAYRNIANSNSPFSPKDLSLNSNSNLFLMGFLTNLLNPQVAILYMTVLPQFIKPQNGSMITQSLILGSTQITISLIVNSIVVLTAGSMSRFFQNNPRSLQIQKWLIGIVLACLAVRLLLS